MSLDKKVKTSKGQKASVPKVKGQSKGQKVLRSVKRSIGKKGQKVSQTVKRSIGQKLNRSMGQKVSQKVKRLIGQSKGQKVINMDIEKYKRHFSHETVW